MKTYRFIQYLILCFPRLNFNYFLLTILLILYFLILKHYHLKYFIHVVSMDSIFAIKIIQLELKERFPILHQLNHYHVIILFVIIGAKN